jgi:diacylglycerol O-acyltransferase
VHSLELIAAETAARKRKARPQAGTGIFRLAAGQRTWYRHFPQQRSVNLVVTDAPARRCRYTWPVRRAGLIMR